MKWREDEVGFLRENYNTKVPLKFISEKLKRSPKSIQRKAQNIGLHREWVRFNKPTSKQPRYVIDKRYYEKNKEKVYQRKMKRRRKIKEEIINLLGGKCKICGYDKCIGAFDFHHTGDKEGHISSFLKNESRQKVLKEAKKCILLCANCHRELHYKGSVV